MHAFLPIAGDADGLRRAFQNDPGRWLPGARHAGPDTWTMTVRGGQFSRGVTARVSAPWRAGDTLWRSLSWDPVGEEAPGSVERFLPSLDGELGLHVSPGGSTLMVDARYRPPGGPVGAALDRVALHRVARRTMDRLLADISAQLCSEALLGREEDPDADDDPGAGGDEGAREDGSSGTGPLSDRAADPREDA